MEQSARWKWLAGAAIAAAVLAALAGMATRGTAPDAGGRSTAQAGAGPASGAAPARTAAPGGAAVSVSTVAVRPRDVPVQLDATGTVVPLNSVEVRPQVSGRIARVHIREGQFVKAGEVLFTLDTGVAEANLAQARAQLQKDQASLADAQRQLARSKDLFAQGFIAQGAVDTTQAQADSLAAVVSADRAAIEAARVTLDFTRITAPLSGRAGAIDFKAGSTVQANTTTLVTLTQLDPIAVSFNLPQRYLTDALRLLREGGGAVTATLPDHGNALTGKLQFVDNAVDAASGTVKVKAQFDNAGQGLWPGAFVDVRLTVQTLSNAIVVPQAAVILGERGRTVYVVQDGNKVAARPVEVRYAAGTDAVVSGLQPGERVVVEGRQNLRPGAVVVERRAAPQAARAGSAAGSEPS